MRSALLASLALGIGARAGAECYMTCTSAGCLRMSGSSSGRFGPYASETECETMRRQLGLSASVPCVCSGSDAGASGGGTNLAGAAGALLGAGMTNSMQGAQIGAAMGSAFFQGLDQASKAAQQRRAAEAAESLRLQQLREAEEAREAEERHGRLMGQLKGVGSGGGLKLKTARDLPLRDHTIKHVDELSLRREALGKLKGKPEYDWCHKNFTKLREPTRPIYEVAGEYERQWKQYRRAARDWDNKCDGPSAQPGYVEPDIPGAPAKAPEPARETPKVDDGPTIGGLKLKTGAREAPRAQNPREHEHRREPEREEAIAAEASGRGGLKLKGDISEFETVNPGGQAAPDVPLHEDEKVSDRSQDGFDRRGRLGALGTKPGGLAGPDARPFDPPQTPIEPAPTPRRPAAEASERRPEPEPAPAPRAPIESPLPAPAPAPGEMVVGDLSWNKRIDPKAPLKEKPAGCDYDYRQVARAIGIEEEIRAKGSKLGSDETLKALRTGLSIADHETVCSSKAGRCFLDEDPSRLSTVLQRASLVAPRERTESCEKGQFTDAEIYFLRKRAQKAGRPLVVTGGLTDTGAGLARRYQAICTRDDALFKPFRHKKLSPSINWAASPRASAQARPTKRSIGRAIRGIGIRPSSTSAMSIPTPRTPAP